MPLAATEIRDKLSLDFTDTKSHRRTYPLWDMTRDWMPKRASVVKPEAV
jgi:hypothetical protein